VDSSGSKSSLLKVFGLVGLKLRVLPAYNLMRPDFPFIGTPHENYVVHIIFIAEGCSCLTT
jgi:hypothetical protein